MTALGRKVMLILLGLMVLAFAALVVACEEDEEEGPAVTPGVTPSPTGEVLAEKQEYRLRTLGEPTSLDPQIAAFATDINIIKQLFRGLLWYDEDLGVVPAAAKDEPAPQKRQGNVFGINLGWEPGWDTTGTVRLWVSPGTWSVNGDTCVMVYRPGTTRVSTTSAAAWP